MITHDAFYMVFVEGGTAPAVKHADHAAASTECKRLAEKTRRPAFVMQAITGFQPVDTVEPVYMNVPRPT